MTLLSARGVLSFINPNSLLVNESYSEVRRLLLPIVFKIVKLPDNVFQHVIIETMLLLAKRGSYSDTVLAASFGNNEPLNLQQINFAQFAKSVWSKEREARFSIAVTDEDLKVCAIMERGTMPLEEICEFSLGITPYDKYKGHSKATIDSRAFHAPQQVSAEYVPLISGENVRRYAVDATPREWLRYGPWLGAPRQKRFFDGPRIIVRQIISGNPPRIFAGYTDAEVYHTQIGFVLLDRSGNNVRLLYVLALLNSRILGRYHSKIFLDPEKVTFQKILIANCKKLPIPRASDAQQREIAEYALQILALKASNPNADVSDLEAEIDRRVEFLYFHADEAPTYDEWVAKRDAERGTVIEEIRTLIAIGHETDGHEFKSSFAWDVRKNERGDYLKDEVHTAICAFLNARSGEVLIGVDDDGNVLGLEKDLSRYGGKDKLVQAIEAVFGNKLAPNPIGLVRIGFVEIDGKTICRVRVQGDRSAMYKFNGGIYVRRNSGSKPALTAEEAAYWWPRRQRGEA